MGNILTTNDGARVVASTYWGSQMERDGYLYLTPNKGVWRLLVPAGWRDLGEARTGVGAAITRGPWRARGKADAVEVLFDDGSDNPYVVHLGMETVERVPEGEDTTERRLHVVAPDEGGEPAVLLDLPCRYRLRPIPCLDDWLK